MSLDTALALSATQILAIPPDCPERLFTGDIDEATREYRKLAAKWHPDRGGNDAVFAHVAGLFRVAGEKLVLGNWHIPGQLIVRATNGSEVRIVYRRHRAFELGDMFIGDTLLTYRIEKPYRDLAERALASIKLMKFASPAMHSEMSRALPNVAYTHDTMDGQKLIVMRKPADAFALRDVLAAVGGKLEPKHVGWVLSRLYNIACYLRYNDLMHGDISLDSMFVAPSTHLGLLLGGWWYAQVVGKKLVALPARTCAAAPRALLADKRAAFRIDTELIRLTGRELLGDPTGSRFNLDRDLPPPVALWLRGAGTDNAHDEYKHWHEALQKSFGARRFHRMDLSASDIYQEK